MAFKRLKRAYEAPRILDIVVFVFEGTAEEAIRFEGTAEEAIRFLDGEHAEETIRALRAEGLLGGSGS